LDESNSVKKNEKALKLGVVQIPRPHRLFYKFMRSVIVITQNCNYWDEIPVRKAVLKILKGKVSVLAHNGKLLGYDFDGNEIWNPLIIQLRYFSGYKCKATKISFSHSAVFDRDDNICQYWHNYKLLENGTIKKTKPFKYKCTEEDRTIDHILPISRGGVNNFLNTVCACKYCNEIIKRNRTPEEVGLRLISKPKVPKREIGEWVRKKFAYNPNKESHRRLVEMLPNLGYTHSHSLKKALAEASKCNVLCSNCHRELHFKERSSSG